MNPDGSWTRGAKWALVQLKIRETKKKKLNFGLEPVVSEDGVS